MAFTISEEPIATLVEQADVPMIFTYMSILEPTIVAGGLGGFLLTEKPLEAPRSKDYDAVENDRPADWVRRFDVTNWGFIVARSPEGKSDGISEDSSAAKSENNSRAKSADKSTGRRIGGAVIAFNSPDAEMLERRKDLAVLWDLRVHPDFRGERIGASLFSAAENWARERGCVQLKIETQNNNVAACKFYARQGCTLGAINRLAYPNLPHEIQMIWYKALT